MNVTVKESLTKNYLNFVGNSSKYGYKYSTNTVINMLTIMATDTDMEWI